MAILSTRNMFKIMFLIVNGYFFFHFVTKSLFFNKSISAFQHSAMFSYTSITGQCISYSADKLS